MTRDKNIAIFIKTPIKRGLLVVFDMQKEQYRMINLKTISNINIIKNVIYKLEKRDITSKRRKLKN